MRGIDGIARVRDGRDDSEFPSWDGSFKGIYRVRLGALWTPEESIPTTSS